MTNPLEFKLEKYKGRNSRFTCPACKKPHEFTRYIHPSNGERLPNHVGKCNRVDKCGYHFSNWDYFNENPKKYPKEFLKHGEPEPIKPTSYVERSLFDQTLRYYPKNNFYLYLCKLIGKENADKACAKYFIGTSKHWEGGTIFWQVDINNQIRTGKVMLYNVENGKRVHKKQTWVHSILKMEDFNLSQCIFGEHLLALNEYQNKVIAIVESEKTAIIASHYIKNAIWLATGGLELLNPATNPTRFKSLVGKNVILFPDLSLPNKFNGETPFKNWTKKVDFLKSIGVKAKVSEKLELIANEEDRSKGFDIADYIAKECLN